MQLEMNRWSFNRVNNLIGIAVFLAAAVVYCLTVEDTASFWDCGEFILSGYKLEVGHPPGAPFFMLTANVFTQLTGDAGMAARMVNYMSALMSAATIWLLYLSIVHLVRKLMPDGTNTDASKQIIVFASGIVGALAYTFSDTFWFSAVEGEVYAFSSLFTALVFWLILKWEDEADTLYADRWLVLIAYLMGLSIGVHLLNLLCIPAIALIWYFRQNEHPTFWGMAGALLLSGVVIMVVLYGILPGIIKVGGHLELLLVNQLGMPFNSGLIVYLIILTLVFVCGLVEARRARNYTRVRIAVMVSVALLGIPFFGQGWKAVFIGVLLLAVLWAMLWNEIPRLHFKPSYRLLGGVLLSMTVFMIGMSSYGVIMIRSAANTPMDQNSPDDIFALGYYLGREQYGSWPLLYGPSFLSEPAVKLEKNGWMYDYREGPPIYKRKIKQSPDEPDTYVSVGNRYERAYAQNMLFPRMYSESHAENYRQWVDIKGKEVTCSYAGEETTMTVITQWENLRYFVAYQLNYMYWRYFLWNFVGRQNDIQGHGEREHGNWITGIGFVDRLLIGDVDNMPDELRNNPGRNVYYGLPLLLGLLGMFWQVNRGMQGMQSFVTVFMLFIMTGIAIVVYLNQVPVQVRERDYAYAASFYAFTIWMGMGVAALASFFERRKLKPTVAAALAAVVSLCIPLQMASQTWDDHDRSGCTGMRDFGQNYLVSAQESGYPVVFTMGDNDTFPLWYNQEVEGFRTDVRTCNAGYLQSDWYIDQMKRPAYTSPALPISWTREEYMLPETEGVVVRPELKKVIEDMYRDNPEEARREFGDNPFDAANVLRWAKGEFTDMRVIPTDTIIIPVDREAVLRSGMMIPDSLKDEIPSEMVLSLKGRKMVYRSEIMMLETVLHCNWERPVYIAVSVGNDGRFVFDDFLIQEGMLQRITPFNTAKLKMRMDSERTLELLTTKFRFGGVENDVYMGETSLNMLRSHRGVFASVATQLLAEGKPDKARRALEYCAKVIPESFLAHDFTCKSNKIAECYYLLGDKEAADHIVKALADNSAQYMNWYLSMPERCWNNVAHSVSLHYYLLSELVKLMEIYNSPLTAEYMSLLDEYYRFLSL